MVMSVVNFTCFVLLLVLSYNAMQLAAAKMQSNLSSLNTLFWHFLIVNCCFFCYINLRTFSRSVSLRCSKSCVSSVAGKLSHYEHEELYMMLIDTQYPYFT